MLHRLLQSVFARRPQRRLLCWRTPRSTPRVAITFDDGPNTHTTPRVLQALSENGVQCTFFVLGREVRKCPAVLQDICEAGHEIGIHGFDHRRAAFRTQVRECAAELARHDVYPDLVRPPMGRFRLVDGIWLAARGMPAVLWSFDAHDSMRHEGKWSVAPDYDRVRAGDIVLMHDDNPVCVADLPAFIDTLRSRGLEAVTVSELLA